MIQFNKTIFQFTQRLVLVAMLMGFSTALYGSGIHSVEHKSTLTATMNPTTGAGQVYVGKAKIENNNNQYGYYYYDYQGNNTWYPANNELNQSCLIFELLRKICDDSTDKHRYYLLAVDDEDTGDFLWDGWYKVGDGNTLTIFSKSRQPEEYIEVNADPDGNNQTATDLKFEYQAVWLVPKVIDITTPQVDVIEVTIDDKSEKYDKTVKFQLENDRAQTNYSLDVSQKVNPITQKKDLFSPMSSSYTSGEYSTGIQYSPNGIHTAHSNSVTWIDEKPQANKGVLTLTSNFKGNETTATSKSLTLIVNEDYTPWFEMEENEVSFVDQLPGAETSTLVTGDKLEPKSATWNYAASQPKPIIDEGDDPNADADDKLINGCKWSVWIDGTNADCFSISGDADDEGKYHPEYGKPIVTFHAPAEPLSGANTYTATLHITCEYYDAMGNCIPALEKNGDTWGNAIERTVTLNATAIVTPSLFIDNATDATIRFDNVVCGAPLKYSDGNAVILKTVPYITNIANIIEEFEEQSNYITINADRENAQTISAMLKDNIIPGSHRTKFKVTGIDKDNNTHSATLTVLANVIMAAPILSGYAGNGSVHLEWTKVPGATEYILYYISGNTITVGQENATQVPCDEKTTSKDITLANGTYSFVLVAKCGNDALDQPSNVITLRPTEFPVDIAWKDRITSLYTGTETDGDIMGSNFPYMTKRRVDVTAAFDTNAEGEEKPALFDYMVIFGQTINKDNENDNTITLPSENKASNALTPCYVYSKQSDNKTYHIYKIGNENSVDMNDDSKHKALTIDATQDADKKISIYFTGFCPFASTGNTWGENAVVHIIGDSETQVDIYLDNAQIFARPKKFNNTVMIDLDGIMSQFLFNTRGYMSGSGAVFAFSSKDVGFAPKIHLSGANVLKSHKGVTLSGSEDIYLGQKQTPNTLVGTYEQMSAPIQLLPTGLGQVIDLTIDDIWGSQDNRVNGSLLLSNHNPDYPLFDIGKGENSLTLNGGQVTFNNKAEVPIVSYYKWTRKENLAVKVSFTTEYPEYITEIFGASTASSTTNGVIHSVGRVDEGFAISFNDGTFNAVEPIIVPDAIDSETERYYTTIDGGSYNCIFASTMHNRTGKELHKISTEISSDIAKIINGLVIFNDGLNSFRDLMDYIYPSANWMDQENPTKHYASLSTYYDGANKSYGYSSLTPDAENKVHLLLPKEGNPKIKNWSVSGPAFNATIGESSSDHQGSPLTIHCTSQAEANTFGKTYKMLYVETDEFTKQAIPGATAEDNSKYKLTYGTESGNAATATITSDFNPASINNQQNYIVSDKVYMMKPIVATDWMLFCPPFDVANMYIIEAYPETQLIKDFATPDSKGNTWNIIEPGQIAAARKAQSQRWMDLYLWWYNYAQNEDNDQDFFTEEGYASFVNSWMAYEQQKNGTANTAYTPIIDKMCHFMGKEATYPNGQPWYNAAHYYLYESNGAWTLNEEGTYTTTWNTVTTYPDGKNPIMKAGKVYALNFPYNTIGGHNPLTTWDYWTGKYILIESTTNADGHTIRGAQYDMIGVKSTENGQNAWLCGNATFAAKNITDTDADQIWTVENHYGGTNIEEGTIEVNTHEVKRQHTKQNVPLKPTEGFLLASPIAQTNMIATAINYRTGEITYEKIDNPDDDNPGLGSGVPTIMNGMTLIVEPNSEGLTITPIKEQHVMLFDADGKMIFSKHLSAEENVTLPTGVYVVRGEYEQVKAIKK